MNLNLHLNLRRGTTARGGASSTIIKLASTMMERKKSKMVQSIMIQKIRSMMPWTKVVHSQNAEHNVVKPGNSLQRLLQGLATKLASIMMESIMMLALAKWSSG